MAERQPLKALVTVATRDLLRQASQERKCSQGELVEQASLEDIRQGSSLEERFLERVGADEDATQKLSWLEEAAP